MSLRSLVGGMSGGIGSHLLCKTLSSGDSGEEKRMGESLAQISFINTQNWAIHNARSKKDVSVKGWVFIKVKGRKAIKSIYAGRILDCFPT